MAVVVTRPPPAILAFGLLTGAIVYLYALRHCATLPATPDSPSLAGAIRQRMNRSADL